MDYDQFESNDASCRLVARRDRGCLADYLLEQRIEAEEVAHLNSLPAPDECDSLINPA